MRVLLVHPSVLMYSELYLRLEPLGLEVVAEAARQAGHDVRVLDLQVFHHSDVFRLVDEFRPDAVGFSINYLANVPEVIELAQQIRERLPRAFVFAGGHSGSFTARDLLEHAAGALDCVLRGEGEAALPALLEAAQHDRKALARVPGAVTPDDDGPPPGFVDDLDRCPPARDLTARRRKYFIGELDPCASIEFTRGCPWDCHFCSAWTFYGRSYRHVSPEAAVENLARVREPAAFIVDDVAFIRAEHGYAIGREIERRDIRKKYYLETRGDVLLRNKDVFKYWKTLGLEYMFLGLEAIDEEGLRRFRKRVTLDKSMEAVEYARSLGIMVAINIIADPDWDETRFAVIREFAQSVPEIVHLTVNTPYPGTESWHTDTRELTSRDYRLFDIQHAVLPTRLPLARFYEELVRTQRVLATKHMGLAAIRDASKIALRLLLQGQTNFLRMIWRFNSVYDPRRQLADHERPVRYEIRTPRGTGRVALDSLYVHPPNRRARQVDATTERFVESTSS
jgi:hopanoid C-3 methylase HpnR